MRETNSTALTRLRWESFDTSGNHRAGIGATLKHLGFHQIWSLQVVL